MYSDNIQVEFGAEYLPEFKWLSLEQYSHRFNTYYNTINDIQEAQFFSLL